MLQLKIATSNQENQFYKELNLACIQETSQKHEKLIVLGDFNATTSLTESHSSFNRQKPHYPINYTANNNGERMDFAAIKAFASVAPFIFTTMQEELPGTAQTRKPKRN